MSGIEGLSLIQRDMGRLEGRMDALESAQRDDRGAMRAFMEKVAGDVDEIKTTLQAHAIEDASRVGRFKGGWWVVTAVASALLALGGLLQSGLSSLFKH